jgi:hypothetical protein
MLQSSQHCLRKPDYYLYLQGYFACPPGPCSRPCYRWYEEDRVCHQASKRLFIFHNGSHQPEQSKQLQLLYQREESWMLQLLDQPSGESRCTVLLLAVSRHFASDQHCHRNALQLATRILWKGNNRGCVGLSPCCRSAAQDFQLAVLKDATRVYYGYTKNMKEMQGKQ